MIFHGHHWALFDCVVLKTIHPVAARTDRTIFNNVFWVGKALMENRWSKNTFFGVGGGFCSYIQSTGIFNQALWVLVVHAGVQSDSNSMQGLKEAQHVSLNRVNQFKEFLLPHHELRSH